MARNLEIYGAILPRYYLGLSYAGQPSFLTALLGNLVSPSRGLFIYSPVLLFSVTGFIFALREGGARAPCCLRRSRRRDACRDQFCTSVVGRLQLCPRYTTDIVPFLADFTAFNFRALAHFTVKERAAYLASIGVLGIASFMIHAQGALRTSHPLQPI